MVDCSTVNYGCNGGWYDEAWKYIASAGFQSTSSSYRYTATKGTCRASTTVKGAYVSTTSPVTYVSARDVTTMKNLLSANRLVSIAMAVVDSFFYYK